MYITVKVLKVLCFIAVGDLMMSVFVVHCVVLACSGVHDSLTFPMEPLLDLARSCVHEAVSNPHRHIVANQSQAALLLCGFRLHF